MFVEHALIPFFPPPMLQVGSLTIHGFGVCVIAGILLGAGILLKRFRRLGLDPLIANQLIYVVLIGGFIGAHLVDVFFYRPELLRQDPMLLFRVWDGFSSFGGFFGAAGSAVVFLHRKRLSRDELWRCTDALIFAFPFGWTLGRLGCFLAHDHPGISSDFFLAVAHPDPDSLLLYPHLPNSAFLDLGLLEFLYMLLMLSVMVWADRRARTIGFFLFLVPVLYAPVRFGMDFLRVVDVRYLGLTPGQYSAGLLLACGLLMLKLRPEIWTDLTQARGADPAA